MDEELLDDIELRMDGALEALAREFAGLRTGRAHPALLDKVTVDAYGAATALKQVGSISAPEPRLLTVNVWDRGLVTAVEKAIRESDLGLNPAADGSLIRIPIPDLSEERRKALAKVAARYAEDAKVAIRNVRRDGMDRLKKLEKDGEISEDEQKRFADQVQKLTDAAVKRVDTAFSEKEAEILQV